MAVNCREIYFVYKTTNVINGKIYVGQHVCDDLNDGYLGSGNLLLKSVKKYGKENFVREIIELIEDLDYDKLDEREVFWIKKFESLHPKGYNLVEKAKGGFISEEFYKSLSEKYKGVKLSEEHKKKLSEAQKGVKSHNFGKVYTDEEKLKISKSHLGIKVTDVAKDKISKTLKRKFESGEIIHPLLGKAVSEETKNKIRESRLGHVNSKESIEKWKLSYLGFEHSKETIDRLKIVHKQLNTKILICPHCLKSGKYAGMLRWHFDNCNQK